MAQAAAVTIKPNGQTLVVDFTAPGSATEAFYTDAALTASVTLPVTVTSDTTYYTGNFGPYTVSAKQPDGTELWGKVERIAPDTAIVVEPLPSAAQVGADLALANRVAGIYSPNDCGYKAWTFDPASFTTGATALATAGTIYISRLTLPTDQSITNIVTYVSSGGSTLTSGQCFAALFSASGGAAIGVTADQATAWQSTGIKTMALASGPFSCTAGDYYVAAFFNGTTGPSLPRAAGNVASTLTNIGRATPNMRAATADTGRTTTFPSSLGTQTAGLGPFWFALS